MKAETHALKVYYPHGGRHFVLEWWTFDDQSHIVLSKTMEGLELVADRVFAKGCDEVRSLIEIDIVSPPKKLCMRETSRAKKRDVEEFCTIAAYTIVDAFDVRRDSRISVPRPFALCTTFDKFESAHFCENRDCAGGIVLSYMTKRDFYEKYREKWNELGITPSKRTRDDTIYSRAERAKDDDALWFARANFGSHRDGVQFVRVVDEHPSDCDVLFYYRTPSHLNFDRFKSRLNDVKMSKNAEKKKIENDRIRKMNAEKRSTREKICRLFETQQMVRK